MIDRFYNAAITFKPGRPAERFQPPVSDRVLLNHIDSVRDSVEVYYLMTFDAVSSATTTPSAESTSHGYWNYTPA